MQKTNIKLILRKDRTDKYGQSHIRIRTITGNKVNYYTTGVYVSKDNWNGSEVINLYNRTSINTLLRSKLNDFEKRYLEAAITDTIFHPTKKRKVDFHSYWQSKENSKFKKSGLTKLERYRPNLHFSDITPAFLYDYEKYCRSLGNQENTVWNAVKHIKSVINRALKEGVIKVNPMAGYTPVKYKDPKRDYLTEDEINLIEDFSLDQTKHETLRAVANWFLFSCYSFLRYSDCVKFNKTEHIKDGKIILRTQKTLTDVSIKIHPRLQKVLDRLPDKIFTNQKMNQYLKLIAVDIGLNKALHFHLSRHSGSVLFLTKGGSMEALSKLLGHSDLRVTFLYGQVSNKKLDDEISKVFG